MLVRKIKVLKKFRVKIKKNYDFTIGQKKLLVLYNM